MQISHILQHAKNIRAVFVWVTCSCASDDSVNTVSCKLPKIYLYVLNEKKKEKKEKKTIKAEERKSILLLLYFLSTSQLHVHDCAY